MDASGTDGERVPGAPSRGGRRRRSGGTQARPVSLVSFLQSTSGVRQTEVRGAIPKPTRESATRLAREQITERLVDAATTLLAEKGPAEIKARSVAEAANVSTMAVYYLLGGLPELLQAVVDRGFRDLDRPSKRSVPAMTPWPTFSQCTVQPPGRPAEPAPLRSGVRAVHTRKLPTASIADSRHQNTVRDVPGRLYPCYPGVRSPYAQRPHPWRPRPRDRRHPTLELRPRLHHSGTEWPLHPIPRPCAPCPAINDNERPDRAGRHRQLAYASHDSALAASSAVADRL